MKKGTKRAMYIGLAIVILVTGYCVVQSPQESLIGLLILVSGIVAFLIGAFLEDLTLKSSGIPLIKLIGGVALVAGFALVFIGLLTLSKPLWRNLQSENTRLFIAVADGDNETAISILENNPDFVKNARYYNDYTLLHQAAASGNVQMVKYLLERGADLTAKTSSGSTALQLAEGKKSGMQSAPNAGWSLAKNGDLDAVIDLLKQSMTIPPSSTTP